PVPQPRAVPPPPPVPAPAPVTPAIDPALRQRVAAAIGQARQRLAAAQQRKATTAPQYNQAVQSVADATLRANTAKTNDDLNAALGMAEVAQTYADAAQPPNVPAPIRPTVTPTRPSAATDA